MTLIQAAKQLLEYRQGILAKEYDKLSPTLAGALHDLAMAVKAAEQSVQTDKCFVCGTTENINHVVVCDDHDPFS